MTDASALPTDPKALIQTKRYRVLLLMAAVIGVIVSFASWAFLQLTYELEHWVYQDLPGQLGFSTVPTWWPLPIMAIAGVIAALAIIKLPGTAGHLPANGLGVGSPPTGLELPSLVLAAVASISLGLVLGPEAPLIGIGTGLAVLSVKALRRPVPDQGLALLGAAGAFAAVSSLFGGPVVGAVIIIEATGLGGAMLPVILLPGLLAAGIGSLVFIGMGSITGLSSKAYAIDPVTLPTYSKPTLAAFAWMVLLAVAMAVVIFLIFYVGKSVAKAVTKHPYVVIIGAFLVVAVIGILFAHISHVSSSYVLFSGEESMTPLVDHAATFSLATLFLILAFKGVAYGISLGSGRGGPTFPGMYLGVVAGIIVAHLPGFAEAPAVAGLMAAAVASVLRLPLSAILIAVVLCHGGIGTEPLVVVAAVVAYLASEALTARFSPPAASTPETEAQPAPAGT
jgi:H+/Cl- antiporter ClcA